MARIPWRKAKAQVVHMSNTGSSFVAACGSPSMMTVPAESFAAFVKHSPARTCARCAKRLASSSDKT